MAIIKITDQSLASDAVKTAKILDNNVTLAKLGDGTQGDVLYYGASGAPARLGFGTSGDFLKTQGTGANPTWATAGGGAWTFLHKENISADATVDVETAIDSTYPLYAFVFNQVRVATDNQSIFARVKISSYLSTSDYQYHTMGAQSNQSAWDYANANSTASDRIEVIGTGVGNDTREAINGILYLPDPSDTAILKNLWWDLTSIDGSYNWIRTAGFGGFDANLGAVTGVQFYAGSGDMATGDISVYGIKDS
jgi:hypothetical protein